MRWEDCVKRGLERVGGELKYRKSWILLIENAVFILYSPVYATRQITTFKHNCAHNCLKSTCLSFKGVTLSNSLDDSLTCSRHVHY